MANDARFPAMHIAESAINRIMNLHAELLPSKIPDGGSTGFNDMFSQQGMQQLSSMMPSTSGAQANIPVEDHSLPGPSSASGSSAVESQAIDDALNTSGSGAAGATDAAGSAVGAGATDAAVGASAVDAAAGADAAGAMAADASASVAGEAAASGSSLFSSLIALL